MTQDAEDFVVVGAGGHGRTLWRWLKERDAARRSRGRTPCRCVGFLDDNPRALDGFSQYPPILGPISPDAVPPNVALVLGVGAPERRLAIVRRFDALLDRFPTVDMAEDARTFACSYEESGLVFGRGNVIGAQTVFGPDVRVGDFNLFNGDVSVGHDVVVGSFCEISSKAFIGGGVRIGDGVVVGPSAALSRGIDVGAWAKISAGSALMQNAPPCSLAVGTPAKISENFFVPPCSTPQPTAANDGVGGAEISVFIERFARLFDDASPNEIFPEKRFRELTEWNSLLALAFVADVEQEYGVKLQGREIRQAESIADLFRLIRDRIAARSVERYAADR